MHMQDVLRIWGWGLEVTSNLHIGVSSVPYIFGHALPSASLTMFLDVFGNATSCPAQVSGPLAVQTLLQSIACRSAIVFGQRLSAAENSKLIKGLAETRLPFHCAHGRPTTAMLGDLDAWSRKMDARRCNWSHAIKPTVALVMDVSVALTHVRKALKSVGDKACL
jgi:DNA mismatch repair ATPase MutL